MKAQPWQERRKEYLKETGRLKNAQIISIDDLKLQRAHGRSHGSISDAEKSANNKSEKS